MINNGKFKTINHGPKPLIKAPPTPTKPLLVVLKPTRVLAPYKRFYVLAINDFRRESLVNKKQRRALISPFLPYGQLSSFAPAAPSRTSTHSFETNRRSSPLIDVRGTSDHQAPGTRCAGASLFPGDAT